jgi:uncharacterized protein YeaO (DUF488 family)
MAVSVIRLGTPRSPGEGLRIGAVRRPPRGVSKDRYAADNWYDIWYPELSPTPQLMAQGRASQSESDWNAFVRQFRKQMSEPSLSRTLGLLSALSRSANFSLGCYCERDDRCHRSVLRAMLEERGARLTAR